MTLSDAIEELRLQLAKAGPTCRVHQSDHAGDAVLVNHGVSSWACTVSPSMASLGAERSRDRTCPRGLRIRYGLVGSWRNYCQSV